MQDLRERMTQALYSAAPNIGEAVMEYVSELDAHLAAMREALEAAIAKPSWEFQHVAKADVMEILDTTDAGRALLERLAKAEAERVTATSLDSYCRDSGCIPYQEGAWMACEACDLCDIPRYYDYLRSNHMIREAE